MAKNTGMIGAVFALSIFVLGGISTFGGLALVAFMKGRDLFGLGDGRSFGLLLVCVGMVFSILGVLVMRLLRNRTYRAR